MIIWKSLLGWILSFDWVLRNSKI